MNAKKPATDPTAAPARPLQQLDIRKHVVVMQPAREQDAEPVPADTSTNGEPK
jgi:hypothetical protein